MQYKNYPLTPTNIVQAVLCELIKSQLLKCNSPHFVGKIIHPQHAGDLTRRAFVCILDQYGYLCDIVVHTKMTYE
jgi:hypothetical protein